MAKYIIGLIRRARASTCLLGSSISRAGHAKFRISSEARLRSKQEKRLTEGERDRDSKKNDEKHEREDVRRQSTHHQQRKKRQKGNRRSVSAWGSSERDTPPPRSPFSGTLRSTTAHHITDVKQWTMGLSPPPSACPLTHCLPLPVPRLARSFTAASVQTMQEWRPRQWADGHFRPTPSDPLVWFECASPTAFIGRGVAGITQVQSNFYPLNLEPSFLFGASSCVSACVLHHVGSSIFGSAMEVLLSHGDFTTTP